MCGCLHNNATRLADNSAKTQGAVTQLLLMVRETGVRSDCAIDATYSQHLAYTMIKVCALFYLLFLTLAWAAENPELTREEALKLSRTIQGKDVGELWFDHGDKDGPYRHAGRVILDPGAHVSYEYNDKEGASNNTGLYVDDEYWEAHLDFFTSPKGEGWVVCNLFKPEIEPTRPKAKKDQRPTEHQALAPAAKLAIKQGDVDFLKVLIDKGLDLNEALDFEDNKNALYLSVWERKLEVCKFLLERGADPEIMTDTGELPLDLAVEWDMEDFVKLLSAGNADDVMIEGVPSGILERIFAKYHNGDVYFISWNGKDPGAEKMKFINKLVGDSRPYSRMETIGERPLGAHTWYRDKTDGKYGRLLQLNLKQDGEKWLASLRDTSGPIMAGGGWKGAIEKKYGRWLIKTESFFAE